MNIVLIILTILQLFYNRIRHNTRFFALINIILIFFTNVLYIISEQMHLCCPGPDRQTNRASGRPDMPETLFLFHESLFMVSGLQIQLL